MVIETIEKGLEAYKDLRELQIQIIAGNSSSSKDQETWEELYKEFAATNAFALVMQHVLNHRVV